jgi:anti-sigma regulatory factor (Ser/Thr protein kinase)
MSTTQAPTQRMAPTAERLLALPVLPPLPGSFAATPLPAPVAPPLPALLSAHGEPVAILDLPATTGSVASGRRWVVDAARAQGAGDDTVDVVELLASEVLTNAVRHGSTTGTIQVHVIRHAEHLRITVRDASTCLPEVKDAQPDEVGGRGMALVEMLAAAWGVHQHGIAGKSVWFEVALAPAFA